MSDPVPTLDAIGDAVSRGDRQSALDLATAAVAGGEQHALALMLAAERREEQFDLLGAIGLLEQALEDTRDQPELWRRYGALLARLGQVDAAKQALKNAVGLAGDNWAILKACAAALFELADLEAAGGLYRRLAAVMPNTADPLAALAALAARRGDLAEARRAGGRAVALQPGNLTAHLALGRADLAERHADRAEARMARLLNQVGRDSDAALPLLELAAEARDALGRTSEAFADWRDRNAILARRTWPALNKAEPERRIAQAQRLERYFAAADATPWRRPASGGPAPSPTDGHVFLLGFPRSGTTLLEKALAGHSRIMTLPEIDCLGPLAAAYLADDDGLGRLATLTQDEAETLRNRYWAAVAGSGRGDPAGRTVVDKLPLHSIVLPVIAKLFPHARIVFSVRDPRDVVLSCFRRRFQMNAAMAEFLDLGDAARYYDAVMSLAERYRALLPITMMSVRHEDLVARFDTEVGRVLASASLSWEDGVRNFAGRAADDLRTPSDVQLTRGLNDEGVGQWRRYERELAPVVPLIARWAPHFGYAG